MATSTMDRHDLRTEATTNPGTGRKGGTRSEESSLPGRPADYLTATDPNLPNLNPDLPNLKRQREAQAGLLFENAPIVLAGNLICGAALVFAFWQTVPHEFLGLWYGALSLMVIGRALLYTRFRNQVLATNPRKWANLYSVSAACTGVIWGASVAFLAGDAAPLQEEFVIFVLAGMSAASVASSSSYLPAVLSFNVPALLPLAAYYFQGGSALYIAMGIVVLVYLALTGRLASNIQSSFTDRNRMRLKFAKLSQTYQGILENVPALLYRIDSDGTIVECRGKGLARIGLTAAETKGPKTREPAGNTLLPKIQPYLKRALAGESVSFEIHGENDGQPWWFQNFLAFDHVDQSGAYGFAIDVTDRRRAEEAFKRISAEQEMILDSAEIGIVFLKDGLVRRANNHFQEVFGWEPWEIFGRDTGCLFSSREDYEQAWEEAVPLLTEGKAYHREGFMRRKDGTDFWCRNIGKAVDHKNPELGQIWLVEDISDRRRAELELAEMARTFTGIIENIPAIQYRIDNDGVFLEVRGKGLDRVGMTGGEAAGNNAFEMFPEVADQMKQVIATGDTLCFESHGEKDGRPWWFLNYMSPDNANGAGATGFAIDVTEQKIAESENTRLGRIVEDSINEVYVFDARSLKFVHVNRTARNNLGYDQAELEHLSPIDLMPKVTDDEFRALVEPLDSGAEQRVKIETVQRRKDGTDYHVEISIQFSNLETTPIYVAIVLDVTERNHAELKLKQVIAEQELILENTQAAILMSKDRKVVRANRNYHALFGEDPIGNAGSEPVHPANRYRPLGYPDQESYEQFGREAYPVLQAGDIFQTERRMMRGNGELFWCRILGKNIDESDASAGVIWMLEDITERKNAEEQILRLNEQLEDRVAWRTIELETANRELEAFTYSVSHDLRAPLRGIAGFSQILLEDYANVLDDQGRHFAQRIWKGTQTMGQLIDGFLKLSRTNKDDMLIEEVDLGALAERVIEDLRNNDPQRDVAVKIAPSLSALGDAGLLHAVLENLIGNAWKFTGKTECPAIEIGVGDEGGVPAFFVKDNGAGFDMGYAEKLFDPFQRLHGAHEFEGTGIGLATVQRIVQRHNGKVWAEGEIDNGATFYFTISRKH